MDPITIASLIAMIASAGIQYKASSDAAKRQQQQALQAQQRQLSAQNDATAAAAKRASDYDPNARQQNLQQITDQLTQTYDKTATQPQITAQGVQVGSTIPDAQGTADYTLAKAKEEAKTKASLHALAGIMGRIGGATQLRQDEAVRMGDTANDITRIQNGADNIGGIDQIGIQAAGTPNAGMTFAGQVLGAAGGYGMSKSAAARPKTTTAYPEYGNASGATGAWV